MSHALRSAAAILTTGALSLVFAAPAWAHTTKKEGNYTFTVGWAGEPTYTNVQNAVQLFVHDAKGTALDDIGDKLKVVVSTAGQSSDPLDLEASFDPDTGLGNHGEFDAAIVPTRPGDYTFHLMGSINGQNIDDSFTSGDQTFDTVKDPTDIEFPAKDPTPGALATNVDRLNPRVTKAQSVANKAKSSARTATVLAIVALLLGVVLGGGGLLAGRRARRPA